MPQNLYPSEVAAATVNTAIFSSGLGQDFNRMINGAYPTFEVGLNITLPIRNRAAEASNATAQLNQRQQEVQYRQTQNTILLTVRQALITLEQDRAADAAAQEARIYAQQSYDDSVKQLQLGPTNAFTVDPEATTADGGGRRGVARPGQPDRGGTELQSGDGTDAGSSQHHAGATRNQQAISGDRWQPHIPRHRS